MKKLLLTTIVVISMSLASFAGNANATTLNANSDNIESIEKAKPHTQQYKDMKKILDEFEQDVKKAQSCEDLETAALSFYFKLMAAAENEYEEDLTAEEDEELTNQLDRLDNRVTKLQEQWGCEDIDVEPEEETRILSEEELDEVIDDFDAFVNKLESMKGLDFEDENNLGLVLQFVMESQPLLEKIEAAEYSELTDAQSKRFEAIYSRFLKIAGQMGLIDE